MPERMLRKKRIKQKICNCNRHHRPTRSWGSAARHAARAAEKHMFRKQLSKDEL